MNSIGSPGGGDDRGTPWEDGPVLPDSQHLRPSVLFVDDDAYMRRLMTARLVHLDAEVEATPSAQAALPRRRRSGESRKDNTISRVAGCR